MRIPTPSCAMARNDKSEELRRSFDKAMSLRTIPQNGVAIRSSFLT